jgi:hypothetical protein
MIGEQRRRKAWSVFGTLRKDFHETEVCALLQRAPTCYTNITKPGWNNLLNNIHLRPCCAQVNWGRGLAHLHRRHAHLPQSRHTLAAKLTDSIFMTLHGRSHANADISMRRAGTRTLSIGACPNGLFFCFTQCGIVLLLNARGRHARLGNQGLSDHFFH